MQQSKWTNKDEAFKPQNTVSNARDGGDSIIFRGCFDVDARHKVDGVMK